MVQLFFFYHMAGTRNKKLSNLFYLLFGILGGRGMFISEISKKNKQKKKLLDEVPQNFI